VVVLLFRRRVLMIVCGAMVVLSLGLRLILLAYEVSPIAIYVMTPTRLDALALGGWAAMALRGPGGIGPLIKPAKIAAVVFGLLTLALAWHQGSFAYQLPLTASVGFTVLAVLFAAMLILVLGAKPSGIGGRVFASKTLGMLGRYSYALYIFHQPVITVVNRGLTRLYPSASTLEFQLLQIVIAFPLAVGLACLSWHLFEKHFLKLKRYFASAPAVPVEALASSPTTSR
jgi:peptidoglycan/LPS O-acetylase OafA/YrhL